MSDNRADRRRGGLLGLLLGDAVGVPFEFFTPHELQALPQSAIGLPYKAPLDFFRAHDTAPAGAWSDDGAQALALLDSLDTCQGLDLEDFGHRMLGWMNNGDYAVRGRVFDIGIQTQRALERLEQGVPPAECGGMEEFENGNGSLMRAIPLALWHQGSDEELVVWAHAQSSLTHAHPRSMVCCAWACLWARELLNGAKDGFEQAQEKLHAIYAEQPGFLRELGAVETSPLRQDPTGKGYVVDCFWSARQAFLAHDSFEGVVRHAVLLGYDTDTTAAVAGALAGIRSGQSGLPSEWLEALADHPSLEDGLRTLSTRADLKLNKGAR